MSSCDIVPLAKTEAAISDESWLKTLIIHRDPSVSDTIRSVLSASQYEVVADCVSGVEALEAFDRHRPEIIWLDVKAARVEILKDLINAKTNPLILYLVEEDSTLVNELTSEEIPFVIRRVETAELAAMIPQLRSMLTRSQRKKSQSLLSLFFGQPGSRQYRRFAFKSVGKLIVVSVDEIVSIETEGCATRLFTRSDAHSLKYSLAQVVAGLPPRLFYRLSPSAVVNVQCVRELSCGWGSEKFAVLNDGRRLRITKSHATQLKRIIDATWGMKKNRIRARSGMVRETLGSAPSA